MQELAAIKPLLTALIMPPGGPLLLILLGWVLLRRAQPWLRSGRSARPLRHRFGHLFVGLGALGLWLLSCNAVAVWLAHNLVGQPPAITAAQLKTSGAQAIVVLGGGIDASPPEWANEKDSANRSQLTIEAFERLRYGAHLARETGLPLAYSGGVGWAAEGFYTEAEATVAARQSQRELGVPVRFVEARSRDTRENARESWALLSKQNITQVAVVTNAWHMRRSVRAYNDAGFRVTPAPMGYVQTQFAPALEWLPTATGLSNSRTVLREWLGYQMGQ
jgi:uncharacterized SAM-binding protein YcdF (DUF218 family)